MIQPLRVDVIQANSGPGRTVRNQPVQNYSQASQTVQMPIQHESTFTKPMSPPRRGQQTSGYMYDTINQLVFDDTQQVYTIQPVYDSYRAHRLEEALYPTAQPEGAPQVSIYVVQPQPVLNVPPPSYSGMMGERLRAPPPSAPETTTRNESVVASIGGIPTTPEAVICMPEAAGLSTPVLHSNMPARNQQPQPFLNELLPSYSEVMGEQPPAPQTPAPETTTRNESVAVSTTLEIVSHTPEPAGPSAPVLHSNIPASNQQAPPFSNEPPPSYCEVMGEQPPAPPPPAPETTTRNESAAVSTVSVPTPETVSCRPEAAGPTAPVPHSNIPARNQQLQPFSLKPPPSYGEVMGEQPPAPQTPAPETTTRNESAAVSTGSVSISLVASTTPERFSRRPGAAGPSAPVPHSNIPARNRQPQVRGSRLVKQKTKKNKGSRKVSEKDVPHSNIPARNRQPQIRGSRLVKQKTKKNKGSRKVLEKEVKRINCFILFLAIWLITIGGLLGSMFYYTSYGYGMSMSATLLVPIVTVGTSCCFVENSYPAKGGKHPFQILYILNIAMVGIVLYWHGSELAADKQLCDFQNGVRKNCLIERDDNASYPTDESVITSRIALHAGGISICILILILTLCRFIKVNKKAKVDMSP